MKRVGLFSTAVLSLALGAAVPAYAQQEQRDQQEENKAKPAQENEKKAEQAKPEKQAEKSAKPEEKNARQEERTAPQQEKNTKQEEKNAQQQDKNSKQEEKNAKQQEQRPQQAKPDQQEQRAGGNHGNRIPDDRFRANFGREHRFRVSENDYRRDRRFQYGGYWFGFVDPWPSNWLYTQDVFVVEIDGVYYLCNPSYPGVNIALSVAL